MPTSERLIQEPADESATSPLQDLTGVGCVSFLAGATKDQFAQRSVQSARDLVLGPAQVPPLGPYLHSRMVIGPDLLG
jgi:hypothetical protein